MSVNKVLNSLDRRLTNVVKLQGRNIRELKTPQALGGDILQVQSLPTQTGVNLYDAQIPPGLRLNASILYTVANETLTLWNFLCTVYIDPVSFNSNGIPDDAHRFPDGGALTAGQANLTWQTWIDWATSSDTTNARMFKMYLINNDSVQHQYYIAEKAYLPNLNQDATT